MKRLVLLGEGHGEVLALPILVGRLLEEKGGGPLHVDSAVIRTSPAKLVRWDKANREPEYSEWVSRIELAARRRELGAVLAVYDGDFKMFPAGSDRPFCAATAAKSMAEAAKDAGAGKLFSLCVVFACKEYETWLVAGAESFLGRRLSGGRALLPQNTVLPASDYESRGKGWLEDNGDGYRPTRDQAALTELLDFRILRAKNIRSFQRLEHAISELLDAVARERHISTPG